MAVKGSGALSILNDIVAEFGGVAPHSLSEYYGGGTYVPAGANPGIATSGAINFGSHYGGVAATVLTISSNTNNYDIGAAAIAAGGDKSTPVILTINSGVTVGSTSTGTAAMFTGTGWSSGTTINITNNGAIVGAVGSDTTSTSGGSGGSGGAGSNSSHYAGYAGSSGGTGSGSAESVNNGGNAFEHSQTSDSYLSVIFDTAGTRTAGASGSRSFPGGGGGGGGGGQGLTSGGSMRPGGGGGGGATSGSGGTRGNVANYFFASSGSAGGASTGGSGGAGLEAGGNGGNGGSWGASGSTGSTGGYSGGPAIYHKPGGSGGSAGSTGSVSGSAGSVLSGNTGQIS